MKTVNTATGTMTLLPPPRDACQVCARKHDPAEPHDAQSLYWATARAMEGLPAPTWKDALAHVAPDVRAAWVESLAGHGIVVDPPAEPRPKRRRRIP
jgi:hypothetical protein